MTAVIDRPTATGRLRTAWAAAHAPVAGVPRWARTAALAVPFVVLRGRRLTVPWVAPWVLALLVTTVWLARVL